MSHSKESENFKLFQEYDSSPPPPQVEDTLLERIRRDLHPSPWRVFFKLSSLHAFVGTLTLFVCPQFGYSFTHHSPLMHWFMQAGDIVCQLACGAFFLSSSVAIASLTLSRPELRLFWKHKGLLLFSLIGLSLGIFISLGAEIVLLMTMYWFLGSLLGGLFSLWLSQQLRWLSNIGWVQ